MRGLRWGLAGLLLVGAAPMTVFSADSRIIYRPQPVESGAAPAGPEEGILVQGITICKGDTLRSLSRKYRGRASYFPQILLFNKIDNPDRIFTGSRLLVPVTAGHSPMSRTKKKRSRIHSTPGAAATAAPAVPVKARPTNGGADPSHLQYQRAVTAYKNGQPGKALEEFDRFLANFPDSPLAADATLYRADCLLNLSRQ
ncbi:tetratricopeptide repeat protein [Geotalea sp. SG265]|uniref:LysM peptidoglycan-binding domain-containing protein n=1 Tax=Geotalea sp. SG265 TaxID=2922867 RepID=UPI001FB02270|nr:tetratricopeptide repeat protein [Geotalea sp. SG265]